MATGNMHKNLVGIGRVVPKISSRAETHTQTDRHTHHNTLQYALPIWSGVINHLFLKPIQSLHSIVLLISVRFKNRLQLFGNEKS